MNKPSKEFQLINWIRHQKSDPGPNVTTGIGDDMAVLQLDNETVLVTTDMLLDGSHFDLSQCSLEQAGYKAMACSLSDCAAMASRPVAAVVAVALPRSLTMDQAQQLHAGLQNCGDAFSCPIIGGDTTSWDKSLAVTVTMLSQPMGENPVLRSGAKPGDAILVTGELGGSLDGKHLSFTPRLNEVQKINEQVAIHALIDISDGLAQDMGHMCEESGVVAILDKVAIPLSNAARNKEDPLQAALGDGEDFELLISMNPADADTLLANWKQDNKTRLSCIGQIIGPDSEITDGTHALYLRDGQTGTIEPVDIVGWQHEFGK
jgi:thiamine-monophosphate kinase